MGNSWQRAFEKLFQTMESNNQVEVISKNHPFFPFDEGLARSLATMLQEEYGYTLPPSLEEIANFPMEISLFWKVRESSDPELFGEFHLENVINAISLSTAQVQVYNEDLDEATKSLMRRARYFDAQPSQGWNTATVLLLDESKAFPDLWYLDNAQMHKMELGLSGYFEALFLTKGMYYWQYLYCDRAAYWSADPYKRTYIAHMIEALPSLFPDASYEVLFSRYEQLRKEPTE